MATALAAAVLGGCGDDAKLVPASDASAIDSALQRVADATNAGDCAAATAALADAQNAFAGLPSSVSPRLRQRIADGLEQLTNTVPEQCGEAGLTTETQPTETTTEPTTETTPTETTPTETVPTETTPTETTPTETQPDSGGIAPGEGVGPDGQGPPGQQKKEGDE